MKKIFFLIVLILGTSVITYANERVVTVPVQSLNIKAESVVQANNIEKSSNADFSQANSKKKKKKKLKTWQYIVGGVLIAVIVVFAIIAPNGYNSRTGI